MSREPSRRRASSQVDRGTLQRYGRTLAASRPYVRALLPGLRVDAVDRDDVMQDVLLAAWKSITSGHYQPPDSTDQSDAFERWLYGVTWRQCSHYRGTAWKRRATLAAEPCALAGGEPAIPSHEGQVAAREALTAFDDMPAWTRWVFVLRFIEERNFPELAEIMGCKESTAANRVRLTRAHFLATLQRRGEARHIGRSGGPPWEGEP